MNRRFAEPECLPTAVPVRPATDLGVPTAVPEPAPAMGLIRPLLWCLAPPLPLV